MQNVTKYDEWFVTQYHGRWFVTKLCVVFILLQIVIFQLQLGSSRNSSLTVFALFKRENIIHLHFCICQQELLLLEPTLQSLCLNEVLCAFFHRNSQFL